MDKTMHLCNGVRVFSASRFRERELLGDAVTTWLRDHPAYQIVDKVVTQSSDSEYHCLTITIFYRDPAAARAS